MEAVTTVLVNVAIGVLTIFGPPLAVKLTAWAHAHAKGTAANTSLTLIENVVRATVADIGQSVIPQFKAKLDAGTLTSADVESLASAALARLKTTFGQDSLTALASTLQMSGSTIDQFLSSQVKLAVLTMQQGAVNPSPSVAVTAVSTPPAVTVQAPVAAVPTPAKVTP